MAMNLVDKNLITIIRKIVSICFITGILLSFNLWHSDRQFPLIPVFNSFIEFSTTINYGLFFLLLISLTAVFFSANRKYVIAFLSIIILLILQDQTRLQPWTYIYILILLPYLLKDNTQTSQKKINYFQLIFIGIYIWSGIHKLNPNFVEVTFRSMILFLFKINNASISNSFLSLGYGIPVIEIGIGLSLIFRKTRKFGVVLAIISHAVIIIFVSAAGGLTNSVVYPWNIAMVLCVFFLFYKLENKVIILKEPSLFFKLLNIFIFFIALVLPSLNLIGRWDTYMSFSFYSSKIKNYYIFVEDKGNSVIETLVYQEYFKNIDGMTGGGIIDLNLWSYKELNVPFFPEKRVFSKLKTLLCSNNLKDTNLIFIEFDLPLWDIFIFEPTEESISKFEFLRFAKPLNLSEHNYTLCSKSLNTEQ